jgi:hypothetical protein
MHSLTLEEYEQAERDLELKDARRGLVVHAVMALLSVAIHLVIYMRWGQRSVERKQANIERAATDLRAA